MTNDPNFKRPPIVWWVIWAALLTGIFVIHTAIGVPRQAQPAPSASPESSVWMVGFVPFVVSTMIRWLILPRVQGIQAAFSLFIVGLAMGEVPCILGISVFPTHKLELFVLSVMGIGQFAPYFASRFVNREG